MNNLNETLQYKLCSMLIHSGKSIDSGHYYSYVRTSNNDWYVFNDHSVKKVERHKVLNQKPYLLFYEKLLERPKKQHKTLKIGFFRTPNKNENRENIDHENAAKCKNYSVVINRSFIKKAIGEILCSGENQNYLNRTYHFRRNKENKEEFLNDVFIKHRKANN